MKRQLDLNADLGEGAPHDADLMALITSCNIACGGHAGDAATMRTSLELAKFHKVAAGAHPAFPDRENFGRVASPLRGDALYTALADQVQTLVHIADAVGHPVTHLKPHGALYNMAAKDDGLASVLAQVTAAILPGAKLVGPPKSALTQAASQHGIAFVAEGFADRAYEADGGLRSRTLPGAVITDPEAQTAQAIAMATTGTVGTYSGAVIDQSIDTLCIHGDTPGALAAATSLRAGLIAAGVTLCPIN